MATNPPSNKCAICGGEVKWRVVNRYRPPGTPLRFGPTEYERLPHTCGREAVEKWLADAFEAGKEQAKKPFFTRIGDNDSDGH